MSAMDLADATADALALSRAADLERAGITIRKGASRPGSLTKVERWMVRQDDTFRVFRSELDAYTFARELAESGDLT